MLGLRGRIVSYSGEKPWSMRDDKTGEMRSGVSRSFEVSTAPVEGLPGNTYRCRLDPELTLSPQEQKLLAGDCFGVAIEGWVSLFDGKLTLRSVRIGPAAGAGA